MAGAALFNGNYVKLLKDQLKFFNTARILTGTDLPTVVAKEAEKGSVYMCVGEPIISSEIGNNLTTPYNPMGSYGTPGAWGNYGARFTATSGAPITSARLYTRRNVDTGGYIEARIYSISGGLPQTLLATSSKIYSSAIPTTNSWLNFSFASPITPSIGTEYAITFYISELRTIFTAYAGSGTITGLLWSDSDTPSFAYFSGMSWNNWGLTQSTTGTKSRLFIKQDEGTTTNWKELDPTDAFSVQKIESGVATLQGGSIVLSDGRILMSHDGSGSAVSDFETQLALTLSSLLSPTVSVQNPLTTRLVAAATGTSGFPNANYRHASSITVGANPFVLQSIRGEYYKEFAINFTATMDIYSDSGNKPSALIASSTNTMTQADITGTSSATRNSFTFNFANLNLSAGTKYWSVLRNTGSGLGLVEVESGSNDPVEWHTYSSDGGLTWGAASHGFVATGAVNGYENISGDRTEGHLYIDLASLSTSPTQINGSGEYVYPVDSSKFVMTGNRPEITDQTRFVYIASMKASGGQWVSTNMYNSPKRMQPMPLKFVSPVTYTKSLQAIGSIGTSSQVKQGHVLTSASFPSITDASWYNLDNVNDENTVLAHNLTAVGTPVFTGTGVIGDANNAVVLNGSTQLLSSTDVHFNPGDNDFSLGAWFNAANWTTISNATLFSQYAATKLSFKLTVNTKNTLTIYTSINGTAVEQTLFTLFVDFSGWNHIALRYIASTNTFNLYINGLLIGSHVMSAGLFAPASSSFGLGAVSDTTNSQHFSGSIDEFFFRRGSMNDEDIRKVCSFKLVHNKDVAPIKQSWEARRVRDDGKITEEIADKSWLVDQTDRNFAFIDFSDYSSTDMIEIVLIDETANSTAVLPVRTFDTGWMTAQPTGDLLHGLPDVPTSVVLQYESVTGDYTVLNPNDYLTWDSTNIHVDLASFALLTIGVNNKWRLIASSGAFALGIQLASLSQIGMMGLGDQHFMGSKWFKGNITPEDDNTWDLGTSALRWKSVHVGPGSLVVHNDNTNTKKLTIGFDSTMATFETDSSTPIEFQIGANQIGLIGTNGAWTLGPAAGNVTHVIQGKVQATQGVVGIGAVPVGSILPWIGGYFGTNANTAYTSVLASADTVVAANTYLNALGYYVCDGTALNIADSPVWNAANRYLPNLTDERFLMGTTAVTVTANGGSNVMTDHTHSASVSGNKNQFDTTGGGHNHGVRIWRDPNINDAASTSACAIASGLGNFSNTLVNTDIYGVWAVESSNHSHAWTGTFSASGSAGSGSAPASTDNRPKYMKCYMIIRVK